MVQGGGLRSTGQEEPSTFNTKCRNKKYWTGVIRAPLREHPMLSRTGTAFRTTSTSQIYREPSGKGDSLRLLCRREGNLPYRTDSACTPLSTTSPSPGHNHVLNFTDAKGSVLWSLWETFTLLRLLQKHLPLDPATQTSFQVLLGLSVWNGPTRKQRVGRPPLSNQPATKYCLYEKYSN